MKKYIILFACLAIFGCKDQNRDSENPVSDKQDSVVQEAVALIEGGGSLQLSLEQANNLANLPLQCITTQYPNKLGQVLGSAEELAEPMALHPAFYGCFDWHSSVHGHWSLVSLLKQFPDLTKAEKIKETLKTSLSKENIQTEIEFFRNEHNKNYERTYGWAWILKLSRELHTWKDPLARELETNLQPLTDLIAQKFTEFLPKLVYPIRVGEHSNTAFALVMAYDYALATENEEFLNLIKKRSSDFYLNDDNCPISWEPSGFDFLSPCMEEIDIMRRVLSAGAFKLWMEDFMPQLKNKNFTLEIAEVSDRTDGKLVHLDGLNFSRAWVLYGLAKQYPAYAHLKPLALEHIKYSLPNVVGDTYEGGHWLGTFAVYALQEVKVQE